MAGSGTTLVAAKITGRRWCGIDTDGNALAVAANRLEAAAPEPLEPALAGEVVAP